MKTEIKEFLKCGVCGKFISKAEQNKNGSDLCQKCLDDVPTNEIECVCGTVLDVPENSDVECECGFTVSN